MIFQDGGVEGYVLIFSCKNSKIITHCWTTDSRRMMNPTKRRYPHPRAKEKPQQDGRRGKIMFRIKPHIHQRRLEGSNKPCAHQDPEIPETEPELCLSVYCGSRWRRKWQLTPVFLPGKSHGQRSLGGCSPWGRKGSDTTEHLHFVAVGAGALDAIDQGMA